MITWIVSGYINVSQSGMEDWWRIHIIYGEFISHHFSLPDAKLKLYICIYIYIYIKNIVSI